MERTITMHFAISFLIFLAGWLHSFTGHTYGVDCPPPHTQCAVVDMSAPRIPDTTYNHYQPIFSASITISDLQVRLPWETIQPDAEYWFFPLNEQ